MKGEVAGALGDECGEDGAAAAVVEEDLIADEDVAGAREMAGRSP